MSQHDLTTEEGRAAYRKELRNIGRPLRLGGLALIILAALVMTAQSKGWGNLPQAATLVAYGMLPAGWALYLAAVFMRTRHHKRLLAEGL